jgi:phosphoglycolate phosphatase
MMLRQLNPVDLVSLPATYGYGKVHESETSEQLYKICSFPELISLIKH